MDDYKNNGDNGDSGVSIFKVLSKTMAVASTAVALYKGAEPLIKNTHGFIHKRIGAEVDGKKGDLVWDYVLYNEITFDDIDGNIVKSFFTSRSDEETEREWNKLVNKYGVNNG